MEKQGSDSDRRQCRHWCIDRGQIGPMWRSRRGTGQKRRQTQGTTNQSNVTFNNVY